MHYCWRYGTVLFAIGFLGVLIRRNTLVVFMCLELMLVASTLALVAFSRFNGVEGLPNYNGQMLVFFIITVAAALPAGAMLGSKLKIRRLMRSCARAPPSRSRGSSSSKTWAWGRSEQGRDRPKLKYSSEG